MPVCKWWVFLPEALSTFSEYAIMLHIVRETYFSSSSVNGESCGTSAVLDPEGTRHEKNITSSERTQKRCCQVSPVPTITCGKLDREICVNDHQNRRANLAWQNKQLGRHDEHTPQWLGYVCGWPRKPRRFNCRIVQSVVFTTEDIRLVETAITSVLQNDILHVGEWPDFSLEMILHAVTTNLTND